MGKIVIISGLPDRKDNGMRAASEIYRGEKIHLSNDKAASTHREEWRIVSFCIDP